MKHKLLLLLAAAALLCSCHSQRQALALGADISWETELESRGHTFATASGTEMECTQLMQTLGLNAVRLRVWVNPANGYCNAQDLLAKALRAKRLGMDIMVDFHYSDMWADPGKQYTPAAWADHNAQQLADDVAQHTKEVLTLLKDNGIVPKWVQIGNETTHGLLWPLGRAEEQPDNYAAFIQSGCRAAKEVFPQVLTIVHLDNGFDQALYDWNLGILKQRGVDYDLIGMSLYPVTAPEWHPDKAATPELAISRCFSNIAHLWETLGKQTIITEVGVRVSQPEQGKKYLGEVVKNARRAKHCLGVFYWEPEAPNDYNGGYDMGAFESHGKQLRPTIIMDAFKR